MGEVRTEITLVIIEDQADARRGYIPQEQVRQLTVNAVVDTGAWDLVINEETRAKLGLRVLKTGEATGDLRSLAGGGKVQTQITEPVDVCWKDRETPCRARNLRFPSFPARKTFCWGPCPGTCGPLTCGPLRGWT